MAVKGEQRSKFAAEVSYDGSGEIGNMERDRKLSGGELLDYVLLPKACSSEETGEPLLGCSSGDDVVMEGLWNPAIVWERRAGCGDASSGGRRSCAFAVGKEDKRLCNEWVEFCQCKCSSAYDGFERVKHEGDGFQLRAEEVTLNVFRARD
ncbi:hypothetical protein ACET3Z_021243 [Daucus carota]